MPFMFGLESVDHEHEALVALINELYPNLGPEGSKDRVDDFLGEPFQALDAPRHEFVGDAAPRQGRA